MEMMWKCDVCEVENVCNMSTHTHLVAAILMVKRDHERLNPSCEWEPTNIHGWLFHHSQRGPNTRQ